jgi:glucose/mannose-6-phosphate isomerase
LHDLLTPERIKAFDRRNVHRTYESWPLLARSGFEVKFELPRTGFRKAYVLGMGGSAAGGDILTSWLSDMPKLEMATFKGQVPIENMSDSLAIACSASGQTEETIEMTKDAVRKGATTVTISAGGRLMEVSRRLGLPHIMMPEIVAPRYMLPFMVFSCLSVLKRGLGLDCDDEAENAIKEMRVEGRDTAITTLTPENPSKQLALFILEKTPVVYGSRLTRGAGVRFKNSLNENAKRHAIYEELPDALHNDMEAWEDPSGEFAPIFLRHRAESGREKARADVMIKILSELKRDPVEIKGRGKSNLAKLITLVYRLDMTSYYVAIGNGRDPFPTALINRLKREI